MSKSVGCCKRFPGKTCLASRTEVAHWIQELADEICERLEDDLTLVSTKVMAIIYFIIIQACYQ